MKRIPHAQRECFACIGSLEIPADTPAHPCPRCGERLAIADGGESTIGGGSVTLDHSNRDAVRQRGVEDILNSYEALGGRRRGLDQVTGISRRTSQKHCFLKWGPGYYKTYGSIRYEREVLAWTKTLAATSGNAARKPQGGTVA